MAVKVTEKSSAEITRIPVSKIKLGENSRTDINYEELDQLMASIKNLGLLQPIGVAKRGNAYEVVFGNRRFLACSKLGWNSIPAVIRAEPEKYQLELENLSENVQRRNLSLLEIGRWLKNLKDQGLVASEVAVRLGVSKDFVNTALQAFERVPEDIRDKVEVRTEATKGVIHKPGTISIAQAQAIFNAKKKILLNATQERKLYDTCLQMGGKLRATDVYKCARNLEAGLDVLSDVKSREIHLHLRLKEDEYERLYSKYVEKGPFKSVNQLGVAMVRGEVKERFKLLSNTP